jgi:hypothetical protein
MCTLSNTRTRGCLEFRTHVEIDKLEEEEGEEFEEED